MKHKRLAWAALFGTAAAASAAHAQLTPDQMAAGRPDRSLLFVGSEKVEYDTNVARTSPELAAQEGLQLADTVFSTSLNTDAVLPIGRQALFLNGVVGYVSHVENTQLDHARIDISGGMGNKLGPCGSVLSTGYFQGRSELENAALSTSIEDLQSVQRIDLSLTCVRPPGLGVFASGSRVWATNSAPNTTNGNYETTTVSGGLIYQRMAFGTITLSASDSKTDYSQDGLLVALGPTGFDSKSIGAKVDRRLGGRIEASVSLFYTKADIGQQIIPGATTGTSGDFSGLTYTGDISFRASSRLSLHGGFDRSVKPSLIPGGSFELDTLYRLGITYKLGSHIELELNGEDHDTEVHGDIPAAFAATTLTDARSKVVTASARYNLTKRLSFVLAGNHETRDANNALFAYDNTGVSLTAEVRF